MWLQRKGNRVSFQKTITDLENVRKNTSPYYSTPWPKLHLRTAAPLCRVRLSFWPHWNLPRLYYQHPVDLTLRGISPFHFAPRRTVTSGLLYIGREMEMGYEGGKRELRWRREKGILGGVNEWEKKMKMGKEWERKTWFLLGQLCQVIFLHSSRSPGNHQAYRRKGAEEWGQRLENSKNTTCSSRTKYLIEFHNKQVVPLLLWILKLYFKCCNLLWAPHMGKKGRYINSNNR